MKKIIILLRCCGLFVSMVGCGGNTAPPPTESPPTTEVEPPERKKETSPTESADQATEPTTTATEPTTTAKPKEESKPTVTTKLFLFDCTGG